jgi:class 3 adenylate cyclase
MTGTPTVAQDAAPVQGWLAHEGEIWSIGYGATVVRLRDGKGLRFLAALVEQPGTEIHALDLVGLIEGRDRGGPADVDGSLVVRADSGDAGAVLDDAAKHAYRRRLEDLREELAEAEAWGDPERVAAAREEMEFLARELSAAVGLGGRDRRAGSAAERARVNVTRALKSTVRKISEGDLTLGRLLEASVRTGTFCEFQPPPGFVLRLGGPRVMVTAQPPPVPVADRTEGRAVRTVVYVELLGGLAAAGTIEADEIEALVGEHDTMLRALVRQYGGEDGGHVGERTLITFADTAAALACAEALVVEGAARGVVLRAGVHIGECEVLGESLTGLAVHVSSRIGDLASGGEVLRSEQVRGEAERVGRRVLDRGTHELRGITGAWTLFALDSPVLAETVERLEEVDEATLDVPLQVRLASARATPLVGRADELERLAAAVDRAATGENVVVALAGEPGIGKTRLVAEAAAAARSRGAIVLYGRCDEDLGIPYQPFAEALAHYAEHAPTVRGPIGPGAALGRLVPQFSAPDGAGGGSAAASGDRHALFAEVASVLGSVPLGPVVLILDDLQWADRSTLLMLRYLLGSSAITSLAVILAYRDTDLGDDHPLVDLLADISATTTVSEHIALAGLEQVDIVALAFRVVGDESSAELVELARSLSAETGGNAFFLIEILRHLGDSGALKDVVHRSQTQQRLGEGIELPGSVRETIRRRVGRLGPEVSELLSVAAVVGQEFDLGLLCRAADQDEDDVLELLDHAIAAAMVAEPDGEGLRYRFAHALVGQTLYEALPPGRRRRTHRRVAGALEAMCAGNPAGRIAELAHHVLRGAYSEDLPRALRYAREAGDHALARFAPQEAERWYERALGLLDDATALADADAERCELLIALGIAQNHSGKAIFRETLLEAAANARARGDRDRLVRAALANTRGFASATGIVDTERVGMLESALAAAGDEDSAERSLLLALLAAELTFSGEWERRRDLSDLAIAIARRGDDAAARSEVLSERFMTIWTPETLAIRAADTVEALELADVDPDPLTMFRALHWRAVACVEEGHLDEASKLVRREIELAQRLAQPTALWLAAYDRATQALMRGLLGEASAWALEAGRIAQESGQPEAQAFLVAQLLNVRFEAGTLPELEQLVAGQVAANPGIPSYRSALALVRAEAGNHEGATELLESEAADDFARLPYDSNWLVGLTIWAEACARVRAEGPAETLHRLLEPWADQVAFNSATVWGLVQRHVGTLAAVLGRSDEAQERLRDAAARHEAMGAPIWLARTRLDLASLLLAEQASRPDEPRQLLEHVVATARDLGCVTLEQRAVQSLEELL